jgi:hypothetical protein
MTPLEMVRAALAQLGDGATAEQLVRFVADRFGVALGVKFVPVYRATLRAEQDLKQARERASAILAGDRAVRTTGKSRISRTTTT